MTSDQVEPLVPTGDICEPVLASLKKLGHLLAAAKDDWCLIGGAAFLLHGVGSGELNDIDVVISEQDAVGLMHRLNLTAQDRPAHQKFRSKLLLCWEEPATPVEFMVDLEVCSRGVWHQITPKVRQRVSEGDTQLYVPAATELIDIARLFGRPKDLRRTNQLSALRGLS